MKHNYLLPLAILLAMSPISTAIGGQYAVVVSQSTHQNKDWKPVVDTLVSIHRASVIEFEGKVADSLETLRSQFPKYTCFVATPEEVTAQFVSQIH